MQEAGSIISTFANWGVPMRRKQNLEDRGLKGFKNRAYIGVSRIQFYYSERLQKACRRSGSDRSETSCSRL